MIPETISHYRVLDRLGEGGMGEVYLAEDMKLSRKVAIKFLSAESLGSERARKRLIREAQAAAALDHPNICSIYEIVEEKDHSFIVMQHLEGETLDRRILRKPLKVKEAVEFAVQIADALSEAHSYGIVHRDIKPQNLMVTLRGQIKVLDFGLAKVLREAQDVKSSAKTLSILSDPGVIIGTVPYMSPEQLRAEEVDGRSDIFSFGTVLYEMLSGRQPFSNPSGAVTVSAILTHQPPPLSTYIPGMPSELERIVSKCLEKERDERYQSVRELAVDLRHLQRSLSSSSVSEDKSTDVPRRMKLGSAWPVVIPIALLIGLGLYSFGRRETTPTNATNINSMAVLPFSNVSADPEMEYLSDGFTESLINNLSQLPNMKVIGRSSVFRYKGREVNAHTIGQELGVQAVLSGRIVQHGDELSISVDLEDARDNSHIWGERYNRRLSDILPTQEEITRVITEKLRLKLSGEDQKRLAKHYTDNNDAYQLYLKGRYFWNKRTEDDLKKGIEYFQGAIDVDHRYALAYAGLADSYALLGSGGYDAMLPDQAMPKAKVAATKALEIDETLAEAHTSLAYVKLFYDWDWPAAEEEFKRAIELNANYATAHYWYALYLIAMGEADQSIAQSKRARDLDPLSLSISTNVGRAFYYARQYDRALEECRKTLELDANSVVAHYITGAAYEQKKMYEEAIAEFQKVKVLSGESSFSKAALAHAYAMAGKKAEAEVTAEELKKESQQRHIPPYYLAIVYAGLDDRTQVLEWLERAYHERSNQLVYLKVEPAFDHLRGDAQFTELLRRIGL